MIMRAQQGAVRSRPKDLPKHDKKSESVDHGSVRKINTRLEEEAEHKGDGGISSQRGHKKQVQNRDGFNPEYRKAPRPKIRENKKVDKKREKEKEESSESSGDSEGSSKSGNSKTLIFDTNHSH